MRLRLPLDLEDRLIVTLLQNIYIQHYVHSSIVVLVLKKVKIGCRHASVFLFLLRHSRNARRNECHAPPTNKFEKVVQKTKEKFETVVQKTEEKFEKVVQRVQSSAPRCHKTARSLALCKLCMMILKK